MVLGRCVSLLLTGNAVGDLNIDSQYQYLVFENESRVVSSSGEVTPLWPLYKMD